MIISSGGDTITVRDPEIRLQDQDQALNIQDTMGRVTPKKNDAIPKTVKHFDFVLSGHAEYLDLVYFIQDHLAQPISFDGWPAQVLSASATSFDDTCGNVPLNLICQGVQ